MITFQEIRYGNELDAYSDWQEVKKCSEDRKILLNDKGEVVTQFYQGRVFHFVSQSIKEYSFSERILRVALAILAAIATLGLALISKTVRAFFTVDREERRFGIFAEDANPGREVDGHPGGLRDFSLDSTGCFFPEQDGVKSAMCEHICHYVDEEEKQGDIKLTAAEIRDCLHWLPKEVVAKMDQEHFQSVVIPL